MDNLNIISYAEGWKDAYNPIYKVNDSDLSQEENFTKKEATHGKPILIIIQLVICILMLLTAFGIKTFGGDLYKNLHNLYYKNLNDVIFMTESFETFDLDSIFSNEN